MYCDLHMHMILNNVLKISLDNANIPTDEIVYEYDKKKQSQQFIYVALSRVIFNTLFDIICLCRSRYIL